MSELQFKCINFRYCAFVRKHQFQMKGGHFDTDKCNGTCSMCFECCANYHKHSSSHCPTCNRKYSRDKFILSDGPANSEYFLRCYHWQCADCWDTLNESGQYKCPFCDQNIQVWLNSRDGNTSTSESGDESE